MRKIDKSTYIGVSIVFIIITLLYWNSISNNQKLDNNSLYTKGEIIKIEERFKRGIYVTYQYEVGGIRYLKNQKQTIKEVNKGDVFEVIYSKEDPSNSRLNFKIIINE
ncbi:DUF3592 domain-containing protein [Pseudotenacibaculum sp. MALMAid0570]|uniref:DUF3592 domain-containing protein n=1 Tax=Pseudotenacibaculum sp. MALMAid0570 TaxID=3143938 RepID=UPI0032DFC352